MPYALDGTSAFVAMPCLEDPKLYTTMALLNTQEECVKQGVKVEFGFVTGSLVHHARSLLAHTFLSKSDCTRLFWIDADMKWRPEDFLRVLLHSLKHDIVVGVYPRRRDPLAYFVDFVDGDKQPNADGLLEIKGTGLGFACIRRGVMVHLSNLAPKLKHSADGPPFPAVFRMDDDGEGVRGEDYAFWADCREQGYKIWADTQLEIGHVGTKVYQCSALGK